MQKQIGGSVELSLSKRWFPLGGEARRNPLRAGGWGRRGALGNRNQGPMSGKRGLTGRQVLPSKNAASLM